MREYKRRYEQVVSINKTNKALPLLKKYHRVYYMKPRWLRPGGCDCPCVPLNFVSYYQLHAHVDDDWSSDDEEGTSWAYDLEGNVKWVEYMKTGEKLEANETVVPYVGVVDHVFQDPHIKPLTGRIDVKNDRCLARFYTPMDVNEQDPYESEPLKYRRKQRNTTYEYDIFGDNTDGKYVNKKGLRLQR